MRLPADEERATREWLADSFCGITSLSSIAIEIRRIIDASSQGCDMRVLVIEDEQNTRESLRDGLAEHGMAVDLTGSGDEGLRMATEDDYDLVVLDVMLPGMDGWTVIKRLRERKQVPVLFLTARDDVEDRVKGLELGADDYLVKPFAFVELLARIRTLLRRNALREPDSLQIADLTIDVLGRRVSRGTHRIDLTTQEFALLHALVKRRGDVLSRSYIASQVWDMNFDSDTNVVDVAIRRLRSKIDDAYPIKLVHTVRGVGYVLEERE